MKRTYFRRKQWSKLKKKLHKICVAINAKTQKRNYCYAKNCGNAARYMKNYKKLLGKSDIVFVGKKIAIFVDEKMWHGSDWENQKNDFKSHRDF